MIPRSQGREALEPPCSSRRSLATADTRQLRTEPVSRVKARLRRAGPLVAWSRSSPGVVRRLESFVPRSRSSRGAVRRAESFVARSRSSRGVVRRVEPFVAWRRSSRGVARRARSRVRGTRRPRGAVPPRVRAPEGAASDWSAGRRARIPPRFLVGNAVSVVRMAGQEFAPPRRVLRRATRRSPSSSPFRGSRTATRSAPGSVSGIRPRVSVVECTHAPSRIPLETDFPFGTAPPTRLCGSDRGLRPLPGPDPRRGIPLPRHTLRARYLLVPSTVGRLGFSGRAGPASES